MRTKPFPLTRLDLALIGVIVLLALTARFLPGSRTVDDAFITFRYSRNIIEGQGFVYNPGERTLGTTTPLYTLLMAAISAITRGEDFPYYAITVNALADAGTAALLFLLARRITKNRWMGLLLGCLWAIAPQSVTFAIGGMETSLNIFWMVGAVWLYLEDRPILMGIFAGLGFLTRIDAVIWIGPLYLYQLIEQWRGKSATGANTSRSLLDHIPYRTWIASALTYLPWLLFGLYYFGSPFPRSLTAKTVAYRVLPYAALMEFVRKYSTPFFEFDTFGGNGAIAGTVIYTALLIIGILYTARRLPRVVPFLIYPLLYVAIFSIANPLIFRWYIVPPLPALMLGIVVGAWGLIEAIQTAVAKNPSVSKALLPIMLALLAVLWGGMSLHAWVLHPDHGPDRPAPAMAWHQIELYYQQVGTLLRDKYGVTPQTRVASADIGAVGYFSRATIIDTVGLVTPELSTYYPAPLSLFVDIGQQNYAIPPQLIKDTKPDFFVTMELFVRLGLAKDAEFKAEYGDPIILIPTGFYGTDMRVYQRHK